MIFRTYLFVLLLALFTCAPQSRAQIVFSNYTDVEQMVKKAFLSDGIELSNIRYRGSNKAIQVFSNSNNKLPLDSGLFLSTGHYKLARGPNYAGGTSYTNSGGADLDLARLAANTYIYDAAVLEFDFVATGDSIAFRYVFASEEYPEYVGSKFNDVFGFLISGPGIKGSKNLALVPHSHKPVCVNNINHKTKKGYYIDNAYVVYNPFSDIPDSSDLQFDGLTVVLEARSFVVPGATYHLKIAIADVKDNIFDSGVFLESGSFKSFGKNESPAPKAKANNKTNRKLHAGEYMGVRNLAPPGPYATRIVFDDSLIERFSKPDLLSEKLNGLLNILDNYPNADLEIDLGAQNRQKEDFAEWMREQLIKNGVDVSRISILRNEGKRKNKQPNKGKMLLFIKPKLVQKQESR